MNGTDAGLLLSNVTNNITSNSTTSIESLTTTGSKILHELLSTTSIILITSLTLIIIGSYSTISKPKNAEDPRLDMATNSNFDPTDMDNCKYFIMNKTDLELNLQQELSMKQVLMFPFMAGGVLGGLYYCLKNKISIESILKWYIILITPINASFTFSSLITMIVRKVTHLFGKDSRVVFERYRLVVVKDKDVYPLGKIENIDDEDEEKKEKDITEEAALEQEVKFDQYLKDEKITIFKESDILNVDKFDSDWIFDFKIFIILPASIAITYFFNKNYNSWIWSNFIAFTYVISGFQQFKLTNFKLAHVLLTGLFIYDIYFVFGTEIMMTVATKIDIPMKLYIPKIFDVGHSILGLGDIIIPGLFCSLSLRYDVANYYEKNKESFHHLTPYPKPYFITSLISYSVGIILTLLALYTFKVGQPALLYIVPSLLIGSNLVAWYRGEFSHFWSFSDGLKPFDKNNINLEDYDEEYIPEEIDDELDKFIEKVERKRAQEDLIETDIDDLYFEDDDDTFIIQVDEENDDRINEFDSNDDEDSDDDELDSDEELIVVEEEINLLYDDLRSEPKEWYTSEEEDDEEEEECDY
ncbi:uncharacterized protein KGF55_001605 [Candida pseudojiufengensis]|uniref:uncharacterized protein n=1 Tax=Candida pseudojiufengensis TaxID=497109 RepID=UPI002224D17E|nr:uncharacterized protein KGF55_001605 [Candida pseudojiufengensis]KAI5965384.1 hypothetical protein KGF55_001605 [Candida pseudojiufengensis]